MKNNLIYYKHEADWHNQWEFKLLRKTYGWAGEGKFWALNNEIAKSENCTIDLSDEGRKMTIATDLDFEEKDLIEFIEFLKTRCKLISIDDNKITSKIVQESFVEVQKERERKRDWIKGKRKESTSTRQEQDVDSTSTECQNSNVDVDKQNVDVENEQSKVKESKGKNSTIDSNSLKDVSLVPDGTPAKTVDEAQEKWREDHDAITKDEETLKAYLETYKPKFIQPLARYWNFVALRKGWSTVQVLNDARKKKLKTRMGEKDFDFLKIIEKALQSDFYSKDGRTWFSFDWILDNQTNYLKVIEGNYMRKAAVVPLKQQNISADELLRQQQEKLERQKAKYGG